MAREKSTKGKARTQQPPNWTLTGMCDSVRLSVCATGWEIAWIVLLPETLATSVKVRRGTRNLITKHWLPVGRNSESAGDGEVVKRPEPWPLDLDEVAVGGGLRREEEEGKTLAA